jgi:murein DD-endopeptidase MepM/ murein hydrolase activator NlpD
MTNFGRSAAAIEQVDVLDGERRVLASWSGRQLWQRIQVVGQAAGPRAPADSVQPGMRAVAYLWVSLQPGASAPAVLIHRLTCAGENAGRETITTSALPVASAGPTLASPVQGGPWVAVRGPSNASGHRLSLVTLEGRTRVPQRFAVDWTLLGDDGLPFRGDRTVVTNWHGYDAPVHAVAAGAVALVRDGSPDRAAFGAEPPDTMDATAAPGNVVVVDIGHGRFATYAHLKAGSLGVSKGDRVVEGQLLGRIGNSGNSLGPHLHFHVSDDPEPLAGEGLPFALQRFELVGRTPSLPGLLAGAPWKPNAEQPARTVSAEMPLENMVVRFGTGTTRP